MSLTKNLCIQQKAQFSQHGSLFRPQLKPGYSTQTRRLPTCQQTITLTHTHTHSNTLKTQRLPTTMGPPLWEEAEEASAAACLLLITSEKLRTNWLLRRRQQKQVALFTANYRRSASLNHAREGTSDSRGETFSFIFPEEMRNRLTPSLRL